MTNVIFITGNQGKADFLTKYLHHPIAHKKIDVSEIQSLNLEEIARHKAEQAFAVVKSPVLVEDAGLVIKAMGKLPGPFIKWFHHELGLEKICRLVDMLDSRQAVASVCFAHYDGHNFTTFTGEITGSISNKPKGSNGFGFDPIFVLDGYKKTLAEMSNKELEKYSLRTTTVYPQIKEFLSNLDKV